MGYQCPKNNNLHVAVEQQEETQERDYGYESYEDDGLAPNGQVNTSFLVSNKVYISGTLSFTKKKWCASRL